MRTALVAKAHASTAVKPSSPSPARVLAALKETLSKKGVLQMPPRAVEETANELTTRVGFMKGGHGENYGRTKAAMLKHWVENYGGPRKENPDAWQELQENYSSKKDVAFARSYLAKSVAPAARAKVDALLKSPALKGAQVGFVQSWDEAAEVIGFDRLLITPKNAKYSLVVSFDYVHA
jgi:hypothetical protein